jgi:hypothetical protein
MSKHYSDKGGVYDLSQVHAVTPAIEKNRDGELKSKKAVLHFGGGAQIATDSDYDTVVAAWKGEKPAE